MPRSLTELDDRRVIWERILEAAMRHHGRTKRYGMQKVISHDSGASPAAVSKWAVAKSMPSSKTLRLLADLYQVSTAWIAGAEPEAGHISSPEGLLRRAGDITELVVTELLPNGSVGEFVHVMRRTQELLLDGMSDVEARGQLLLEVSLNKKNGAED